MSLIRKHIGDIVEFHRGYDLTHKNMHSGPYPVVGSTSIIGYHDEYKAKDGIVLGRSGTVGRPQLIKGYYWPHNTTLFTTNLYGNDLTYVYYLLLNNNMGMMKSGSNIPTLNRNDLYPISVLFETDVNKQKQIVAPLATIDSLIQNNANIINNLNKIVLTIYNYWFLQFDFPDENGRPYRSSGGKMVWNEELKREIPEEWEIGTIGEKCNVLLGGTPDTARSEYWNGDIHWLNSAEMRSEIITTSEKMITEQGLAESTTEFAPAGSVLISITRYIRPAITAIDTCFNQSVVAILENQELTKEFLYPFIVSCVPQYLKLRTGAQQPHINKQTIENTIIFIPPFNIMTSYIKKVKPIYQMWINLANENQQLASLRDFLLPLLMNGQVTVKDAEDVVGKA